MAHLPSSSVAALKRWKHEEISAANHKKTSKYSPWEKLISFVQCSRNSVCVLSESGGNVISCDKKQKLACFLAWFMWNDKNSKWRKFKKVFAIKFLKIFQEIASLVCFVYLYGRMCIAREKIRNIFLHNRLFVLFWVLESQWSAKQESQQF